MNFTDCQTKSRATAKYPAIGHAVIYPNRIVYFPRGEENIIMRIAYLTQSYSPMVSGVKDEIGV